MIVPAVHRDQQAYILGSFIGCYVLAPMSKARKEGSLPSCVRRMPNGVVCDHYDQQMKNVLRSVARSVVTEIEGVIVGCCVWSPGTLWWLSVKEDYRKAGVARSLLQHTGLPKDIETPYLTTVGKHFLAHCGYSARWPWINSKTS